MPLEPSASDHLLKMDTPEPSDDPKSQQRKANKPLMEKRRRARINKSLMELKGILVDNLKKSSPGHNKWEKADILEMTVNYVQCLRNQQQANKSDPLAMGQFIAGFSECIRQLKKFGSEREEWDEALEARLTDFLLGYLKTFSDDATRSLKSPRLKRVSPHHSPSTSGGSASPLSSAGSEYLKISIPEPASSNYRSQPTPPMGLLQYPPPYFFQGSSVWRPWS